MDKLEKAKIVALANETREALRAGLRDGSTPDTIDFGPIKTIMDGADLVFGVWNDMGEPDGVGILILKGDRRLRTVVADNRAAPLKIAAVPCTCAEQAHALKEVAGEPAAHN